LKISARENAEYYKEQLEEEFIEERESVAKKRSNYSNLSAEESKKVIDEMEKQP
jgi:hypothetical protein